MVGAFDSVHDHAIGTRDLVAQSSFFYPRPSRLSDRGPGFLPALASGCFSPFPRHRDSPHKSVTWVSIMGSCASRKREIQSLSVQTSDESRDALAASSSLQSNKRSRLISLGGKVSKPVGGRANSDPYGHLFCVAECPLSGAKRTCLFASQMSAFDPKRTYNGFCGFNSVMRGDP